MSNFNLHPPTGVRGSEFGETGDMSACSGRREICLPVQGSGRRETCLPVSPGDWETETSLGRGRQVSAGRRKTSGRRAGDERETRDHNAGDDGETVSKTEQKNQNTRDEGETVSPETSFRNCETSSARLPLSHRKLPPNRFLIGDVFSASCASSRPCASELVASVCGHAG